LVIVQIREKKEGIEYLKPKFVTDNLVRRITILEELQLQESQYEGKEPEEKLTGKVECQIDSKPQRIWSMNWTSANTCIELFGKDTKDWKGKTVQILVMPVSGHDSILVDKMGTAELNKIKLAGGSGKLI